MNIAPSRILSNCRRVLKVLPLLLSSVAAQAVHTVTNTNDSGAGSLRQAIIDANGDNEDIHFNIPGSGVKTISPLSPLPATTASYDIDGRTQPGWTSNPLIEINGASAGAGATGFRLENGWLNLYGLVINRFSSDGVRVGSTSGAWGSIYISNCWIGVNQFGNFPAPNGGHGINVISVDWGSWIADCVISGNAGDGIRVNPSEIRLVSVTGNLIGLGANGTADCGNGGRGITAAPFRGYDWYYDVYLGTWISGNTISCNGSDGIHIPNALEDPENHIPILNNRIGTDTSGTVARGNDGHGISIGAGNYATIGGEAGEGNIIAANALSGISVTGADIPFSSNDGPDYYIRGNFIGTNNIATSLGNGQHGVRIVETDRCQLFDCTIGFNGGHGVSMEGSYCYLTASGNRIGTTATGADIGNTGSGIYMGQVDGGSAYIGPFPQTPTFPGNKIAYNNGAGIRVPLSGSNARVTGNEIWDNTGLGLDLAGAGVTVNDSLDADSGPNQLQNFPVLTQATPQRLVGTLHSKPNTSYFVEIYTALPDASGFGEGRSLITSTTITTDGSGNAGFYLPGLNLTAGTFVTSLANDMSSGAPSKTSEFSNALIVAPSDTGDFSLTPSAITVAENSGSVTFTVVRTGGTYGYATVDYSTTAGTATAGQDFTAQSGTIQFAHGQSFASITIPITEDNADEPDETLTLALSNPTGGPQLLNPSSAPITITDNDAPPVASINNASTAEGHIGTTPLTFTVSLTAPSAFPVSVNWVTSDVSATHNTDYSGGGSGTLNFAAGETSKTLTLQSIGDFTPEQNETFFVVLTSATNATLGTATGTGTITDDDSPGTLQFAAASYTAGESTPTVTITVNRTNGSAGAATVNYSLTGGTATSGGDFFPFNTSGTLQFASGQTSATFTLSLKEDIVVEGPETLIFQLSSPTTATLGSPATTTLTITDNDIPYTISGRILRGDGTGLADANVTLTGSQNATVVTDSTGNYSFPNVVGGLNYAVVVTKNGWYFTPDSRGYTNLSGNQTSQDYTAIEGTAMPELTLHHLEDGRKSLLWSGNFPGWTLMRSSTLAPGSWQPVNITPTLRGGFYQVIVSGANRDFFRLDSPTGGGGDPEM